MPVEDEDEEEEGKVASTEPSGLIRPLSSSSSSSMSSIIALSDLTRSKQNKGV